MAEIVIANSSEPVTPSSGKTKIYVDSSSKTIFSKDDAGNVTEYAGTATLPTNTFSRPKGTMTIADVGKFVQDNAGVAEVCNQTAPVSGHYDTWTVEILDYPVVGKPSIFTCEILAIPDVGSNQLNFIGGAPYIPYGSTDWAEGATIADVAANLAIAWNNLNPNDEGNYYVAAAVGAVVTFTAQSNRLSGSSTFQWVGNPANGKVTQTQAGNLASTFYFANYTGDGWGAQKCVYDENWVVGATLEDVAANLAAAWNLLDPAPIWTKLDNQANPISETPWDATVLGKVVTLTQEVFGDPGNTDPISDNYVATQAWGFWDFSANPLDGDSVIITYGAGLPVYSVTMAFRNTPTASDIQIGGTLDETIANLANYINLQLSGGYVTAKKTSGTQVKVSAGVQDIGAASNGKLRPLIFVGGARITISHVDGSGFCTGGADAMPPTITQTQLGNEYIPPLSTKSFLGKLKAIDGANAVIEVLPIYSAIAKGAISAITGDGNGNGRIAIVDGTHVEANGQSPIFAGKALFDAIDGETIVFK